MYLLDTNVISELRKPQADANVVAWAKSVIAPRMFISVITLKELETGVLRMERRDPAQGKVLRTWLKRHIRLINIIGGALLILVGLLMVSGIWSSFISHLGSVIPGYVSPL